jgi:hypothetical protein
MTSLTRRLNRSTIPLALGVTRWDEAVVDPMGVTELIKGMMACGLSGAGGDETIGKLGPVVGEDMGDGKGCSLNQAQGGQKLAVNWVF